MCLQACLHTQVCSVQVWCWWCLALGVALIHSYTAKGVWALAQLAAACHVSHMQVVR